MRRRCAGGLAIAALGCLIVVMAPAVGGTQAVVPPHLDLLSATIEEVPPIEPGRVVGRGISLRLTLAGPPACGARSPDPVYGFLIDADRNPGTGARHSRLGLGIDARITVTCEPGAGALTSPLGPVSLSVDGDTGAATLEIVTLAEHLPSVRFHWVAFALQDATMTTLPRQPRVRPKRGATEGYAAWSILEIAAH